MSDNVRILDSVFSAEAHLIADIRDVIKKYDGRLSYMQLLGILELLKFEYLQSGCTEDE